MFLENGGNVDMDLLGRFLALVQETPQLPEVSLDSIRNYTGIRIRDQNEDGYYEDRYTFEAGGLKTWEWDRNQDGVPVTALGDIDYDGAFDALETWVDGERLSIAYDSDQDKTYDFFETLTKDGTIKEWDINGDGTMDLREYSVEGGGIAWEYASRLNGVFDVRRFEAGPMESGEEP